jgi:hypothetical protein
LLFNDLRFGAYLNKEGNKTDYIFSFHLEEEDGAYEMIETIVGPPKGQEKEYIDTFFARIWGANS